MHKPKEGDLQRILWKQPCNTCLVLYLTDFCKKWANPAQRYRSIKLNNGRNDIVEYIQSPMVQDILDYFKDRTMWDYGEKQM